MVLGPFIGECVDRQSGPRIEDNQQGVGALPMYGDLLEHAGPERGIERGLVNQADRLVEISYPIAIKSQPGLSTSTI